MVTEPEGVPALSGSVWMFHLHEVSVTAVGFSEGGNHYCITDRLTCDVFMLEGRKDEKSQRWKMF